MADKVRYSPSLRFMVEWFIDQSKDKIAKIRHIFQKKKDSDHQLKIMTNKQDKKILDVGCGLKKVPGAVGIDYIKLDGVDIVHDLNIYPWANLDADTFDEIYMLDVLEHLDDVIAALKECYRLLRSGGKLFIRVAYWNHKYSYSDPTHKHYFSEITFKFFTGNKWRPYYTDFKFTDLKIDYSFDGNAIRKFGKSKKRLLKKAYFYCNVIQGMNITYTK